MTFMPMMIVFKQLSLETLMSVDSVSRKEGQRILSNIKEKSGQTEQL